MKNAKRKSAHDYGEILTRIYDSALKFIFPLDLEETYAIIVSEAIEIVNGDSGRIFLKTSQGFDSVYSSTTETVLKDPRKKGQVYKSYSQKRAYMVHEKIVEKNYPLLSRAGVRSIVYIPFINEDTCYGVMTIRSKTERKFSEDDVKSLKIFGAFATMAIRKAQLYKELKEALDARDLFISLAAHELRTPLTSVMGYFQLLRGRIEQKKPVPSKWLEDMDVETKRLKQIAEEFLEINRIRSGKLQYDFKEIRLKKLVNRSITAFKFSHPERKINFTNRIVQSDKIVGDRDKLIQVVTNVLENAVKYSSPNTDVDVRLKNGGDDFQVEIEDRGQGISKEEIPQIFKGFYKGKNSLHEGMGLGLYLAKNIIDDHHGAIKINSELGKGTKVKISLPKST